MRKLVRVFEAGGVEFIGDRGVQLVAAATQIRAELGQRTKG
jgi:hypothetical protein